MLRTPEECNSNANALSVTLREPTAPAQEIKAYPTARLQNSLVLQTIRHPYASDHSSDEGIMTYLPLHIDVRSVRDLLDSREEFLLLDCREPDEFRHVRIEGASLMPLGEAPARAGDLTPYQHQRIIVYCHHGTRSLQLTQWLRDQGFPQVQNMMGGIDAWALLIDTSLPRY